MTGFDRRTAGYWDAIRGCAGKADETFLPWAQLPAFADAEVFADVTGDKLDAGADHHALNGFQRAGQDRRARDDPEEVEDDFRTLEPWQHAGKARSGFGASGRW